MKTGVRGENCGVEEEVKSEKIKVKSGISIV